MQDRLQEILQRERLTPARFAELVGVQRSSVSHILSGRNKPSLEFLRKTMAALGHISPDWLISGTGPYKRSEIADFKGRMPIKESSESVEGTIKFPSLANSKKGPEFDKSQPSGNNSISEAARPQAHQQKEVLDTKNGAANSHNPTHQVNSTNMEKKVVKTILFYDDQTFEVFYPS